MIFTDDDLARLKRICKQHSAIVITGDGERSVLIEPLIARLEAAENALAVHRHHCFGAPENCPKCVALKRWIQTAGK